MLARLHSATLRGIDAEPVTVEVDLSRGLPAWVMVGLPDASVKESRERIRSSLMNSGFEFPLRHVTVNLSPADRRKEGSHFDLPVALGLLIASGQVRTQQDVTLPFLAAELGLDGVLRPIRGTLSLAIFAKAQGMTSMIVPKDNAAEAAMVSGITVHAADTLLQVAEHVSGQTMLDAFFPAMETHQYATPDASYIPDLRDVRGQYQARRVLEIAAAGRHHLLMVGAPGVGKSMLAERLPGILPMLTDVQRLEVARIYSALGDHSRSPLSCVPPYRAPHHTASDVAMIGGGSFPKPGEISRASYGVLFLDELPEYKRSVLEVLRQPLESGKVCVSRASEALEFPAHFQLIAAMNPCPCGYLGHRYQSCKCTPSQVQRYQSRLSGPLLDRFDLHIHVPGVEREELLHMQEGEASEVVAMRVQQARDRQYARQHMANANLSTSQLEKVCALDVATKQLLEHAMTRFRLSARSYHRILKVSRTIADLEAVEPVQVTHVSEALQYRQES